MLASKVRMGCLWCLCRYHTSKENVQRVTGKCTSSRKRKLASIHNRHVHSENEGMHRQFCLSMMPVETFQIVRISDLCRKCSWNAVRIQDVFVCVGNVHVMRI